MHHDDLVPSKKYHGVYFDDFKDIWCTIVYDRDRREEIECGCFLAEEDAARAYDACIQELQEDPKLNFPEDE